MEQIPSFHLLSFHKALKKKLFILASTLIVLGEISDLVFVEHPREIFILNSSVAIITVIVFVLYRLGKLKLTISNAIVLYSLLFDSIVSPYLQLNNNDLHLLILRLTIIICALIPISGFTIQKIHTIIFGGLYFAHYIVLVFFTGHPFLISSLPVTGFIFIGLIVGNYYLISMLYGALDAQEMLLDKTVLLNKSLEKQGEELQQVVDSKNKMLTILSHDLKSPFNTILGFVKLVRKRIKNTDDQEVSRYLQMTHNSAEKAFVLLCNLLDWTKAERGMFNFKPTNLNLNTVVQDVISLIDIESDIKKVKIQTVISGDLFVYADEDMLSSVLRNLLINSIKFTPENGNVCIAATVYNNMVQINVKDEGVGINPEYIDTLFNPETINTLKGTNNEKGHGLGLLICKEFVEKHNGKIWVENNSDKGAAFYFTLPFKSKYAPKA